MDVKKNIFGNYNIYIENGKKKTIFTPEEFVKHAESLGAGEILLNDIDKDGTLSGYNTILIKKIASVINIPLIILGGARNINDFLIARNAGASAVSAGSMFIYMNGKKDSILINYPSSTDIKTLSTNE